ncbi:MAG: aromatic-ring-hydroxylating dioxygenase subunit beta [Armatimonadota bacterium]|nr:aromatic-ring-hydroxylating dioxygenase subunit beta [Armatimonadota bacterium]MDR7549343.1 aromatic-ring-hydroxylating dioxygenase subunit beta [Armatimonadota bacterium]
MEITPQIREELLEVLYHEAELLDGRRLDEWLALLTEDAAYRMPIRLTRERSRTDDHSTEMQFFWDDRTSLALRVQRLKTEFAWAEDPPSRTRHFISNVRVRPAGGDEVEVRSCVLIYRNRGEATDFDLISGERQDVWRRTDGAWRLARRVFIVDQATLGTRNLAIFV